MNPADNSDESAFSKISDLSKKGLGRAKNTILQSSQTVKARLDLTSLKREEYRLMKALGNEVFAALKSKKLETDLFDNAVSKIEEIQAKIHEKEEQRLNIGVSTLKKSPASIKSTSEEISKDKE